MYWFGPTISQTVPLPASASWPLSTRPLTLTCAFCGTEPTTLLASTRGVERMRSPPASRTIPTHTSSIICKPLIIRGIGVGVAGMSEGRGVADGDGVAVGSAVAGGPTTAVIARGGALVATAATGVDCAVLSRLLQATAVTITSAVTRQTNGRFEDMATSVLTARARNGRPAQYRTLLRDGVLRRNPIR